MGKEEGGPDRRSCGVRRTFNSHGERWGRRRRLQVVRINTDCQGFRINYRVFLKSPNFSESLEFGRISAYKAQYGEGRECRGMGHVYVCYIGVEGRSARQFTAFEVPGEISPLKVAETPGAPRPLSLAEVYEKRLLNLVFAGNREAREISPGRPFNRPSDHAPKYADFHRVVRGRIIPISRVYYSAVRRSHFGPFREGAGAPYGARVRRRGATNRPHMASNWRRNA